MGTGRLIRNVAPGVHQLEHAFVNCYLIEEGDAITIVDAAFPRTWPLVGKALLALGRTPADVRALVLTHAHFDHLGFAARAQEEWGIPVWAHPREEYIAAHPYRYAHENARLGYPLRYPSSIPVLARMTDAGALRVPGVRDLAFFDAGQTLDVPGKPRVVFTPGHTFGHSALFLPDRDAVLSGDALVTFDPYTGHSGPQIVSGAATADSEEALRSLRALEETGARTVLSGHGAAWQRGVGAAAERARSAGPS